MYKTTVGIYGMACSMCEAHINDVIRKEFKVKKVNSSHTNNETVIISNDEIPKQKIEEVINPTGYKVMSVSSEPYNKKGFLSFLKK
ncbi:MAG: heavy-metal-associated domain-containing protein [Ruminococcus sp.]|nr:heavy-metal-associated domain-containing protein [Ruminococcus sp.]